MSDQFNIIVDKQKNNNMADIEHEELLDYLKLDPDHHEKIAALIPKVKRLLIIIYFINF